MNVLPREKQIAAIAALTEGCSIRATERLTNIHRDSIMRLGVRVGEGCARLHDCMMRDLHAPILEFDEIWSYVGKKHLCGSHTRCLPETARRPAQIPLSRSCMSFWTTGLRHDVTFELAQLLCFRLPRVRQPNWPSANGATGTTV